MKTYPYQTKRRAFTAALLILLGGVMMFTLFGCGRPEYAVDYCGQKDEYRDARDTYKAGQKVRLTYFMIGTDTDYTFLLDGERLNPDYDEKKDSFILKFTMPAHDVKLECRAVNSMVQTVIEDDENEETMLVDFYTASVATDGSDGYLEWVLYRYTSDQLKLIVYRQDAGKNTEISTTYIVPNAALERCMEVIDEAHMRTWNDGEALDGEEGAVTVCKFRDTDGSYVRVTSEAMPENGAQAFSRLREILQSYATDTYRQ